MDFPGRYAILGIRQHPHNGEPLFERDRGFFEDCADLQTELIFQVFSVALVNLGIREPRNIVRAAHRANGFAIGPAQPRHELTAVLDVREVNHCFL